MSVAAPLSLSPIAAPAPSPVPTPADREPGSRPFADVLRQSRTAAPPKAEKSAPSTPPGAPPAEIEADATAAATREDAGATAANEAAPRDDAARGRARVGATPSRASPRAAGAGDRVDAGPERTAKHGDRDNDGEAPGDAASTLTGAPFAPGVRPDPARGADSEPRLGSGAHRTRAIAIADGRDGAAGDEDAVLAGAVAGAADRHGAVRRGADDAASRADATGRADARATATRARDGDGDTAATAAAAFARHLGEARSAADRGIVAAAPSAEPPLSGAAAASGVALPTPAPVEGTAAPHVAALPTPIDSPEFPAALGVQVSVFVREGVQRAELHLNPAETGPVSIAITLEGSQAHVAFGADLAATREAIENGLPALASALRDAGFTLAGGGVAQHSRPGGGHGDAPNRDASDGRGAARRGEAEPVAAAAPRSIRRVAAGGVDLYA